MRIIDTHVHLGTSRFSGTVSTEQDILESMRRYGISASLVMPQPTLGDVRQVHREIADMCRRYPGSIYGMGSLDPWMEEADYWEQAEECAERFRFVALKLHPMGHNISPLSPRCEKLYEAARMYGLPVLVHTGLGTPFSLPSLLIEPAGRYPDVTFILCHAGYAVYTDEAIVAAKVRDNIVLEPSWCPTYTVRKMVDQIGAERLLLGSDHISNIAVELAKFGAIGLTDSQLELIYNINPQRMFRLQDVNEQTGDDTHVHL